MAKTGIFRWCFVATWLNKGS